MDNKAYEITIDRSPYASGWKLEIRSKFYDEEVDGLTICMNIDQHRDHYYLLINTSTVCSGINQKVSILVNKMKPRFQYKFHAMGVPVYRVSLYENENWCYQWETQFEEEHTDVALELYKWFVEVKEFVSQLQ